MFDPQRSQFQTFQLSFMNQVEEKMTDAQSDVTNFVASGLALDFGFDEEERAMVVRLMSRRTRTFLVV